MLVLSRKLGESIVIDDDIRITISAVQGGRVKVCIDAPRERRIVRGEVEEAMQSTILRNAKPNLPTSIPQLAGS
jgi:carbon storage regulator